MSVFIKIQTSETGFLYKMPSVTEFTKEKVCRWLRALPNDIDALKYENVLWTHADLCVGDLDECKYCIGIECYEKYDGVYQFRIIIDYIEEDFFETFYYKKTISCTLLCSMKTVTYEQVDDIERIKLMQHKQVREFTHDEGAHILAEFEKYEQVIKDGIVLFGCKVED